MTLKVRDMETQLQKQAERAAGEIADNLTKLDEYETQLAEKDEQI